MSNDRPRLNYRVLGQLIRAREVVAAVVCFVGAAVCSFEITGHGFDGTTLALGLLGTAVGVWITRGLRKGRSATDEPTMSGGG